MPQFANGGIVDFDYGILSQGSDYDSTKIHNPTVANRGIMDFSTVIITS